MTQTTPMTHDYAEKVQAYKLRHKEMTPLELFIDVWEDSDSYTEYEEDLRYFAETFANMPHHWISKGAQQWLNENPAT